MQFNTIYNLGTRCQNAMILKKFGYREFSGFFDYLNIHNIKNLIHILEDEFKTILDPKQNKILEYNGNIIDPETGIMANHALMTFNEFYDSNPLDTICPHYNLSTEKDMCHFLNCIQRFKKLKNYNVLFNFTFNTWEWEKYNPDDYSNIMCDITTIMTCLQEQYGFTNYKICVVGLTKNNKIQKIEHKMAGAFFDIFLLNLHENSYSGGLFYNNEDNENFIKIINFYDLADKLITKEEIDENN